MATKRRHEDVDNGDYDGDSPEAMDGNQHSSNKKRKHNGKAKHKAKEGSSEYAKKRARTIERLLQKNQELPMNVRNDLERELAAHKSTVADKSFQKRRSAMISKYHMVRFFERKKAMRLAKQLGKKIKTSTDPGEKEQLQRALHVAQVDEAYALHHPHAEPYVSLYGKQKAGKEDETAPAAKPAPMAERPPLWAEVEKALEDGPEALKRLRERRSTDERTPASRRESGKGQAKPQTKNPVTAKQQTRQPAKKLAAGQAGGKELPGLNRRERRRLMHKNAPPTHQSDDEDDGEGFFDM